MIKTCLALCAGMLVAEGPVSSAVAQLCSECSVCTGEGGSRVGGGELSFPSFPPLLKVPILPDKYICILWSLKTINNSEYFDGKWATQTRIFAGFSQCIINFAGRISEAAMGRGAGSAPFRVLKSLKRRAHTRGKNPQMYYIYFGCNVHTELWDNVCIRRWI